MEATSMPSSQQSITPRSFALVSAAERNNVIEDISKQTTKMTPVFYKLEWRVEHFETLMRILKNGHLLISEKFKSDKMPDVEWEMHIYPNGKREEDANNATFFLRQIGLELPKHHGLSVRAYFKIYVLGQNGTKLNICGDIKDFINQQGRGKFRVEHAKVLNSLQKDGSLLVICEIECLPPNITPKAEINVVESVEPSLVQSAKKKAEDMAKHFNKQLWENKLFSDCLIQVGSSTFEAHKCILAQHSHVFRSMFTHSSTVEAQSGKIVIEDCSPEAIRTMLEYMYTGLTDDIAIQKCGVELFIASDKYAVLPLKDVCEALLISSINKENVVKLINLADIHSSPLLKKECITYIAMNHIAVLQSTKWKALKLENPRLASELLELTLKEHSSDVDRNNTANNSFMDAESCTLRKPTSIIHTQTTQTPVVKKKRHL